MSENSDNLISIIVPVYNTEKYLKQCLDSIRLQTNHNLDIILIDDGSTDSSAEICDRYEKMDSRIRVFHIKNGGVSNARNYGIQQAKGTWILFQDSDDWIEP
ncbi:MAG: glycosyltransferase family 2 protein, partial [Clostridiaceae bacterium]|nr:glycosyltransferase family 2 protein [Clostridiaceae bacterium]